MTLAMLAIDTGYESAAVHAWARRQGFGQVAPVKGLEGFNRATPVSGPTFVDTTIGGKRLRLERPSDEDREAGAPDPPGTVHLPDWITPNGSSSWWPNSWSPCATSVVMSGRNGKSCGNATRRWTAGSMRECAKSHRL